MNILTAIFNCDKIKITNKNLNKEVRIKMKKIISIMLCVMLVFASAVSVNALDSKSFSDLNDECYIPDNTVKCFGYNIDSDYAGNVLYVGETGGEKIKINFNECVDSPQSFKTTKGESYCRYICIGDETIRSGMRFVDYFDDTGGIYKKIRIKLHDFQDLFNEDGSQTTSKLDPPVTYDFKKKDDGTFDSVLLIRSGAALNAVIPDENGEVEIYLAFEHLQKTHAYSYYNGKSGTMYRMMYMKYLMFGDVDSDDSVNVTDVTKIQRATVNQTKLDAIGKFFADVNSDGSVNIKDATALQKALVQG